jgi:hypothetical protein
MSNTLNPEVREKITTFLVNKGHNIRNLSEEQISNLYWSVINEAGTERTTTTWDSDEVVKNPDEVTDAIQGADDESVVYHDDGSVSVTEEGFELSEEDITEMVRENQNPIMSKSRLVEEMRRIAEANRYEDEYESGENDYAKHLDPESVRQMGRELYGDIRSAAEEKFGEANFDRASMEMARSLQNILMMERNHKEQLAQEAVRLIREKYGALTEEAVDIDAEITGHPDLGGRPIQKGNLQMRKGNTPPPEGKTEEELKPEVIKRRIINGMTHGAARKGQNLFHMAGDVLQNLGPNARQDYSKVMAANDFLYWAMDKETIRSQSEGGVHAGNVRVVIQESGKPKIIAQGMTFSFLLHELTKGVMELMSLHGTAHDNDVRKYVEDKTDHMDAEPDDIRLGAGIWEKVSRYIDIDNPQHEALFYHKLVTLPAEEFNELMKGLVAGRTDAVREVQAIADEASESLRQEEYDDAVGTYDEPTDEPTPAGGEGPEGEYSDPELERILGGQKQDEPTTDEPDYANMSKRDLQDLIDDALDRNDFETVAKISKYLS